MLPYIPPRSPAPAVTIVFGVLRVVLYLTRSSVKEQPNKYLCILLMCSSPWKWTPLKAVTHYHEVKDIFCNLREWQLSQSSGEHQPAEPSLSPFLHCPHPVQSAQNNTQPRGQIGPQPTPPRLCLPQRML